jgi:tetratricopeptide (TPR) repeat protein
MHADYAEAPQLLDMAEFMCQALHSGSSETDSSDPELKEQLGTLRRLSYLHRGVHALHTNQPEVSLAKLKVFIDMLRERLDEAPSRGTDQSLGVAWNELGNAILQNNDGKWAEECFLKSIDALSALDGATAITISMPLINIGFTYWVQGRLTDAAATFQRALEDREKEYGVNDKTSFV